MIRHASGPNSLGPLMVFNNLPSSYRTSPFSELVQRWSESTGQPAFVLYQARRDNHRRQPWFYSSDSAIPYPHQFLSDNTVRFAGRVTYSPHFGVKPLRQIRPTHMLVPGWDAPFCLAAAAYARATGAKLLAWVESNASTSQHSGPLASAYRRHFLRSASGFLVPTSATGQYVTRLMGRPGRTLRLANPVSLRGLRRGQDRHVGQRLLFVGDLSRRKGYDVFQTAAAVARHKGWEALAFGDDAEGLYDPSSGVILRSGLSLSEIAPELSVERDVWVIPSRWDPAPLTYSEALSLGIRVVLSDGVAYANEASLPGGVTTFRNGMPDELVGAALRAARGPAPTETDSMAFTAANWARSVAMFLTEL